MQESEYESTWYIMHSKYMSITTKLLQDVTQYYKNITSPIGANAGTNVGIQGIFSYKQYKRCSRVKKRKTQKTRRGPRRIGLWMVFWRFTPSLHRSNQQPEGSTSSKLWNLDMRIQESLNPPNEWCDKCQVACKDKHTCIDKSK